MSKVELLAIIERLRAKMHSLVDYSEILETSQELDKYIVMYQEL